MILNFKKKPGKGGTPLIVNIMINQINLRSQNKPEGLYTLLPFSDPFRKEIGMKTYKYKKIILFHSPPLKSGIKIKAIKKNIEDKVNNFFGLVTKSLFVLRVSQLAILSINKVLFPEKENIYIGTSFCRVKIIANLSHLNFELRVRSHW